jgi:hypothetical protein
MFLHVFACLIRVLMIDRLFWSRLCNKGSLFEVFEFGKTNV